MATDRMISRRRWLKGVALFVVVAMPLAITSSIAQAKASKEAVHYQDYPSGMRMCHVCKFFIGRNAGMGCGMMGGMGPRMMGTGACEVVEGRISPMGYCDLFAT